MALPIPTPAIVCSWSGDHPSQEGGGPGGSSGSGSGSGGSAPTPTSASASSDASMSSVSSSSLCMPLPAALPAAITAAQNSGCDPYSDVRRRMEALCLADRAAREAGGGEGGAHHAVPTIPVFAAATTYLGYAVLIFVGHIRDLCAHIFRSGRYYRSPRSAAGAGIGGGGGDGGAAGGKQYPSDDPSRYAPLLKSWENFYTRRLYHRIQDCFNRPISSRPGARIDVLERVSWDGNKTMEVLGRLDRLGEEEADRESRERYSGGRHFVLSQPGDRAGRSCLNLGSYNYLGFADDWDVTCRSEVLGSLADLPVSTSSSRAEFGTTVLHSKVEAVVARFLGKEDAMVLNMGFNSNATAIPALVEGGDLLVSDELNHTSIVNGARASGASVRIFRHNDAGHLRDVLRQAIVLGRPRTRRPWRRIMVVVEGIYSMEGECCDLRSVSDVCRRYGAYLYLDEAHSIGATGPTGRGCCEYTGVDPAHVDVLMGTFTKSFGGMGGYIAGSADLVAHLRRRCAGSSYHNSLSPVVCQQILSSFRVIMGEDGTDIGSRKLTALRDNSNYFRMRLTDMGLHVLGHYDSPIMPVMLYNPTKIAAFSRECLKRGLAVVVVGFPAVPILMSRARFCISAAHRREDLDRALVEIDEIATLLKLKYNESTFG